MRQEPIGPYIVDFVCREKRIVIEVDGGQHAANSRDAKRDRWLVEHRYRVFRFWNNEVLGKYRRSLGYDLRGSVCGNAPSPRPSPHRGEGVAKPNRGVEQSRGEAAFRRGSSAKWPLKSPRSN